jgi:ABC-type amino acid transport system permease subunit
LIQIFLVYFALPLLTGQRSDPYVAAISACGLNSGAYVAEIFRSRIQSIDKGQMEAGYMVGLSKWQIYREIIIPQALTVALPILGNVIVDVIKSTSLAFTMSVTEVMGRAKIIGGMTTKYLEMYIDAFFVYVVFIFFVELVIKKIEKFATRYKRAL